MKFQLVSGLHLEKYKRLPSLYKLITPSAPNLILAGNICFAKHKHFVPFFEQIAPLFERIFFILGNNEYYNKGCEAEMFSAKEYRMMNSLSHLKNIKILQKDYIKLDNDIVIIGLTLWSYISRRDLVGETTYLTDPKYILYKGTLIPTPTITNRIHLIQKQWLKDMLELFSQMRIIVVTHHLPSFCCVLNKHDMNNKFLYSNCDELIKSTTAWCAGHIYVCMDKNINGVPVYINSLGSLLKNNGYKTDFVFEV